MMMQCVVAADAIVVVAANVAVDNVSSRLIDVSTPAVLATIAAAAAIVVSGDDLILEFVLVIVAAGKLESLSSTDICFLLLPSSSK
jgi:hypothetical protein